MGGDDQVHASGDRSACLPPLLYKKKHSLVWRKRYSLDEIAAQSLLFLKNSKILSLNTLVGSLKFYAHAASCLLSTNKFVTKKFTTHKKVFTVYLNVYLNLITMFIIMVI